MIRARIWVDGELEGDLQALWGHRWRPALAFWTSAWPSVTFFPPVCSCWVGRRPPVLLWSGNEKVNSKVWSIAHLGGVNWEISSL